MHEHIEQIIQEHIREQTEYNLDDLINELKLKWDDNKYYYDEVEARKFYKFISKLELDKGKKGQKIHPLKFQFEITSEILCVKDRNTNLRRHREALLDISRKNGKGSLVSEVYPNKRTSTHEIDQFIVLSDYGKQAMYEHNFSPELLGFDNGYFIGECKNYDDEVAATWVGKFYTLLRVCGHCSLGIIFSYKGLTGKENNWYDAHGLTKVVYQIEPEGRKIFILDFNKDDFEKLTHRDTNLFKIIKNKKLALVSGSKSVNFDEKHEGESEICKIYEELKQS